MEATEFRQLYPSFQLEDKLLVNGGRDVMTGLCYERRRGKNRASSKQETPMADPISLPEALVIGDASN
jgi:hypothetical protein